MALQQDVCLCNIVWPHNLGILTHTLRFRFQAVTAVRVAIVLFHTIRTIVELRSRWLQFQLLSSRIVLQCHNLKAELSQLVKKNYREDIIEQLKQKVAFLEEE